MSSETKNVEILKEAYQKWHDTRGGSVDHFIGIVAESISFGSLPRGAAPMQFASQYDNREVLRGYFNELLAQWSMNYYDVKQFIAQGDMVVMQGHCSWTHKATGKTCETPKVDIWRFRDGKAVEFYELTPPQRLPPRRLRVYLFVHDLFSKTGPHWDQALAPSLRQVSPS